MSPNSDVTFFFFFWFLAKIASETGAAAFMFREYGKLVHMLLKIAIHECSQEADVDILAKKTAITFLRKNCQIYTSRKETCYVVRLF